MLLINCSAHAVTLCIFQVVALSVLSNPCWYTIVLFHTRMLCCLLLASLGNIYLPHLYHVSLAKQRKAYSKSPLSPMDLISLCALLQTQLKGPLTSFLLKSRENPLHLLGLISGVIIIMVFVTVLISTIIFMRNIKSNKILPSRRIIRRKRKPRRQDDFQQPYRDGQEIPTTDNINCNNNIKVCSHHRAPPTPPNAPIMPPPLPSHCRHSGREWAVPTVSASVASKTKRKSNRSKDNPVNTALVSELKLRLEQKNMANRY